MKNYFINILKTWKNKNQRELLNVPITKQQKIQSDRASFYEYNSN